MSRDALNTLRDRMLEAPDEIDEQRLPERFTEARAALRDAIARIEASGISNETLITVMLSEMLPRMVHGCGPVWTSALLSKLAKSIGEGSAPDCMRQ